MGKSCKIIKGGIEFCQGLKQTVQGPYNRGTRQQGVEAHTLINLDTNKYSRTLIVLKSGDHGKRGIVMNYCPFCRGVLYKAPRDRKRT